MTWPNIIGLGEVMNFPGVAANDPTVLYEHLRAEANAADVAARATETRVALPHTPHAPVVDQNEEAFLHAFTAYDGRVLQ